MKRKVKCLQFLEGECVVLFTQKLLQKKFNANSCKGHTKRPETFWALSTILAHYPQNREVCDAT